MKWKIPTSGFEQAIFVWTLFLIAVVGGCSALVYF